MRSLALGIEEDQAVAVFDTATLNETVAVIHCCGKHRPKRGPIIVIADHHHHRKCDRLETLAQRLIGWHFPPVGQIAGDDQKVGIRMLSLKAGDRRIEPGAWIKPVERGRLRNEMGIGDMDDFHGVQSLR